MKRKYAKSGEYHSIYECTVWSCKWKGTEDEKKLKRHDKYSHELVCPACGNKEFYELLDEGVDELLENKIRNKVNKLIEDKEWVHKTKSSDEKETYELRSVTKQDIEEYEEKGRKR